MVHGNFNKTWSAKEAAKGEHIEVHTPKVKEAKTSSFDIHKAVKEVWKEMTGKDPFKINKIKVDEAINHSIIVSGEVIERAKVTLNLRDFKDIVVNSPIPELVKTTAYISTYKMMLGVNYASDFLENYAKFEVPNGVIKEINAFYDDVITPDYIKKYAPEVISTPEIVAKELTTATCKACEATVYIASKTLLGAADVIEDAVIYVAGTATTIVGRKDISKDIYKKECVHHASEYLDEHYNGSDTIVKVGDCAEKFGKFATYVGLSILTGSESAVVAGIAMVGLGLSRAGNTVEKQVEKTGKYDGKLALYGAIDGVISVVASRVASEIATVSNEAYEGAVAEVIGELGKEAKSMEFLIAKAMVGTENAFVSGATASLAVSAGNFASDIIGKFLDAKDEFETSVKGVIKDAAIGGATNAALFLVKDIAKDISDNISEEKKAQLSEIVNTRELTPEEVKDLQQKTGWSEAKIQRNCKIDENGVIHYKTTNQHLEGKTSVNGISYKRVRFEYNGVTIEGVFPEFNSAFDFNLDISDYKSNAYAKICNEQLKVAVEENPDLRNFFTEQQLQDIAEGITPTGFVWHHNEKPGLMQLVKRVDHDKTLYNDTPGITPAHTGGSSIWGPDSVDKTNKVAEEF